MKVIVVGCGKMGSGLALELVKKGHAVTVVGGSMDEFAMLGKGFKGETIVGVAFDKQILEQAGIERADALCASSGASRSPSSFKISSIRSRFFSVWSSFRSASRYGFPAR